MNPPRILIVKTSSMGDVVHALPAVSDMLALRPDAQIDWLVENAFAAIPQLHPGVQRVIPMAWRKWRGQITRAATWRAMGELKAQLRGGGYNFVLDMQGLLKSAWFARQTGAPVCGYNAASAREGAAAWLYARTASVPRDLQAIERNRRLAAAHLGYPVPHTPPQFGLRPPARTWTPRSRYGVLIPNASRASKLWPERNWVAVGRHMLERGMMPLVLWGRPEEQSLAESIAAGCEGDVPPFLRVGEMAAVLAGAEQVVGLDTGFTHLAAALGRPTLGIYCDHEPGLAGITGPGRVASIGGKGQVPGRSEVITLFEAQLAA